jgi:hypothetical protein
VLICDAKYRDQLIAVLHHITCNGKRNALRAQVCDLCAQYHFSSLCNYRSRGKILASTSAADRSLNDDAIPYVRGTKADVEHFGEQRRSSRSDSSGAEHP